MSNARAKAAPRSNTSDQKLFASENVSLLPWEDEADLRDYFSNDVPATPGAQSNFGAMCERLSRARNPETTELPTPLIVHSDGTATGAPWTEILDCSGAQGSGACDEVEDAMIKRLDAQTGALRVWAVLARMLEADRDVLKAQYGAALRPHAILGHAVALTPLTRTAAKENRLRAACGHFETIKSTIANLVREVKNDGLPATRREGMREQLIAIRREATAMLQGAHERYLTARDQGAAEQ